MPFHSYVLTFEPNTHIIYLFIPIQLKNYKLSHISLPQMAQNWNINCIFCVCWDMRRRRKIMQAMKSVHQSHLWDWWHLECLIIWPNGLYTFGWNASLPRHKTLYCTTLALVFIYIGKCFCTCMNGKPCSQLFPNIL